MMQYKSNYHQRDIHEILFLLNRIIQYEHPMYNIRKLQDIVLDPLDKHEDNMYILNTAEESILLDTVLDLDYFTDIKEHQDEDVYYIYDPEGKKKLIHIVTTCVKQLQNCL